MIEPYVVIKRKQVEVMLDFLGKDYLHGRGSRLSCIQNHIEEYRAYREIFRQLNFRGIIAKFANSENAKAKAMLTPSQAQVTGACVETNVQTPQGMI